MIEKPVQKKETPKAGPPHVRSCRCESCAAKWPTGEARAIMEPVLIPDKHTKRVYVVIKGTITKQPNGRFGISARKFFDVTPDFRTIAGAMFEEQVERLKADIEAQKATKEVESDG